MGRRYFRLMPIPLLAPDAHDDVYLCALSFPDRDGNATAAGRRASVDWRTRAGADR